ncbi:hypothetical protein [Natrinema ejinorense]|uniref:Uncharacterized protein n=1 Tax=Natrinema ejinorense TaxID=373386 RepID=A0A2A5QQR5_9EURY|nr:hypothetical protein [Natrinema ejinorense]PCR89139.1 hypothetical protein CP557_00460 [Natrinema ejinorense]
MFRVILPEGLIDCDRYEYVDNGVELYDEADEFIAFVPYATLQAIVDADREGDDTERSIM